MSTHLVCLGLNHRTAPIALRERLNYPPAALEAALAGYRQAGQGELVILSTCNRLELYVAVSQRDAGPVAAGLVPAEHPLSQPGAPMKGATTSVPQGVTKNSVPEGLVPAEGPAEHAGAPMKGATTPVPQGVTTNSVAAGLVPAEGPAAYAGAPMKGATTSAASTDLEAVFAALVAFIAETRGVPAADLRDKTYRLVDAEAIEHLGRVAAGLDSMVLGEPQILGQVADAMELAVAQRAAGPVLPALFRAAVHAGKRARAETGISRNPTTVSSVAVRLVEKAAGSLAGRQVLIVGAGQMAELAVQALRGRGAARISIANRTLSRAADLAERWGARAVPLDDLGAALAEADIALAATNAPGFVITPDVAGPALAARPERPLVLIDIAMPRDVDPGVRRLPNVQYYDIDDLEAHLNGALAERQQAVPRVEAIVAEEMRRFSDWLGTLAVAPVIADLRAKADAIRRAEVDKTLRRLPNLTPAERQQIENLAEALVNKLLHEPTGRLKAEAGSGHAAEYAAAVRDLFALNG